jgi:acetyltransferase-like isoleucine patch superfamily enzyme
MSSNTSVATVQNGIVTIAENAPIGAMATITASANGKSDECKITVSGEEYGLYVGSQAKLIKENVNWDYDFPKGDIVKDV